MSEFKGTNEKDLHKLLVEKAEAMRTFRFGVAGSKIRNVREGRNLRRDVARIQTALREHVRKVVS